MSDGMATVSALLGEFWHVWLVGSLLALLSLGFLWRFVWPARRLGGELAQAIVGLEKLRAEVHNNRVPLTDLQRIADEVMVTPALAHLWREYAQTLHAQKTVDADGRERLQRWRASTMAEAFFTEQALVDTPLRAEFYKHLPGILTGLGIIGTFSGLILGLTHFEVSGDPTVVRSSLRGLVQGVGHAFKVSATAIALAMLFTWIEKSLLTARHRQVERLVQLIDSLFDAGAGEEYLARLVRAAETSAGEAAALKSAIVGELQKALAQQAEQVAQQQQALAQQLAQTVGAALKEPLDKLTAAVAQISSDDRSQLAASLGDAVGAALDRGLGGFSDKMQESVGGQMAAMNQLLQQTATALQGSVGGLERVAQSLQSAGQESNESLMARLTQTIAALESSQKAMSDNLKNFVNYLGQNAKASAEQQEQQQARFTSQTTAVVGELGTQIRALADEVRQSGASLQGIVQGMAQAQREALGQLAVGARDVRAACGEFAAVGKELGGAAQAAAQVGETMREAAGALSSAGRVSEEALADHRQARETFAALIAQLNQIVDNARREAALTDGLVTRLEAGAERLGSAGQRAEAYLDGVTQVLGEAHSAFASNVEQTLKAGNAQFQRELAEAVGYLKGAIEDLGDALDAVAVRR